MKSSDFLTYGLKSVSQNLLPALESTFDLNFTPNEFDSFDDVHSLYSGGIKLPTDVISKISPLPVLKEILRTDGEQALKFPPPKVIQGISHIIYLYLKWIRNESLSYSYLTIVLCYDLSSE